MGVNLFISVLAYLCGYGKKVLPFWGFYNNEEHVESLSILCYIPLCMRAAEKDNNMEQSCKIAEEKRKIIKQLIKAELE